MKSPWTFLSGLTNRRRGLQTDRIHAQSEQKPAAFEKATLRVQVVIPNTSAAFSDQKAAIELLSTTAIPDSAIETVPFLSSCMVVDEVQKDIAKEVNDPIIAVPSSGQISIPAEPSRTPPLKPSKNGEKKGIQHEVQGAVAFSSQHDVESLSSLEDHASEDALSLDDQIKHLRNQLAQKLHQQNDQLRSMLERFDRS
jgi:hypothetical protein